MSASSSRVCSGPLLLSLDSPPGTPSLRPENMLGRWRIVEVSSEVLEDRFHKVAGGEVDEAREVRELDETDVVGKASNAAKADSACEALRVCVVC